MTWTAEAALAALEARADPRKAAEMAAYHKAPRRYLGVANPVLDTLVRDWRHEMEGPERAALAEALWATDIHEARVAAAKLLTAARIRPDDAESWALLKRWVPEFDAWAIADHAAMAGQRRLTADPARLDEIAPWVAADHLWTRRSALTFTLGFTRSRDAKPAELAARERVLGWAAEIAESREWFLQKAVAWWLRDLSKRDPERVRAWLAAHEARLKPFARREATKYL